MKKSSDAKPRSPALAAARKILAAVVNGKTCNGWTFWEYETTPGNWLKLDTFRK